jgi:hypothetical protein
MDRESHCPVKVLVCLFGCWFAVGTAFGERGTNGSFDEPVLNEEANPADMEDWQDGSVDGDRVPEEGDDLRAHDPFVIIDIWFARCGSGDEVSCPYSFETCYQVCAEIENQSVLPHYLDEIYMSYYPSSGAGHTSWENVYFWPYDNQIFCVQLTIPSSDQCSGRVGSVALSDEGDIYFTSATTGICYPSTGSACDDLLWCTVSDQCQSTHLCRGSPRSCSGGTECVAASCNEPLARCETSPKPAGTSCGSSSDTACDNPDTCNGSGTCQPNYESPTTVCRAAGGECDQVEYCPGNGPNCPVDGVKPSGTQCDSAHGDCDEVDRCDGSSKACPETYKPSSTVCRQAAGDCDQAENCPGNAPNCPTDQKKPPGSPCGNSQNTDCDNPDTCNTAGACLVNNEPSGTPCASDSDGCTDDVCNGTGECTHPRDPNCTCDNDSDCNDDDTCTDDRCVNEQCSYTPRPNCCGNAACDGSETACTCPADCGAPPLDERLCTDGIDNDCDRQVDCSDSDCEGATPCRTQPCPDGNCAQGEDSCSCPQDCGEPPSTETNCSDGADNDCDGQRDCADSDCAGEPSCVTCGNGACDSGETPCSCPQDCGEPACCGDADCDDGDNNTEDKCVSYNCEHTPGGGGPAPPANIDASADNPDAVVVTWDMPDGATDCRVFLCGAPVDESGCDHISDWLATPEYQDTETDPGETAWYRVTCRNTRGESELSAAVAGQRASADISNDNAGPGHITPVSSGGGGRGTGICGALGMVHLAFLAIGLAILRLAVSRPLQRGV